MDSALLAVGMLGATVMPHAIYLHSSTLFGLQVNGLQAAHRAVGDQLGPVIATLFALALLASGLASTSVGGYAGAVIMDGLLRRAFALVPLVQIAADRQLMHLVPTRRATLGVAWLVIGVVSTLNLILIGLTIRG